MSNKSGLFYNGRPFNSGDFARDLTQAVSDKAQDGIKEMVKNKVRFVVCPDHHQAPRLTFQGIGLKDMKVQVSGCCQKVIDAANEALK